MISHQCVQSPVIINKEHSLSRVCVCVWSRDLIRAPAETSGRVFSPNSHRTSAGDAEPSEPHKTEWFSDVPPSPSTCLNTHDTYKHTLLEPAITENGNIYFTTTCSRWVLTMCFVAENRWVMMFNNNGGSQQSGLHSTGLCVLLESMFHWTWSEGPGPVGWTLRWISPGLGYTGVLSNRTVVAPLHRGPYTT